jgi:predicted Rossmann fold nucleotide-binding protein DprA/Smf involved in DNA uptake
MSLKKPGSMIILSSLLHNGPKISPDIEIEKLEKHNIKAFNYHDKDYPARLKEIHDFLLLFISGAKYLPKMNTVWL